MKNLPEFTKNLLDWNQQFNTRQMPWKGETDPYKIWLSEIILQQTRVEQGLAYYEKFINRFPTVRDLALAEDSEVFKYWEGLGYYSRCRNLLATARWVAFENKGQFPSSYQGLLQLKGVGPYTAAAIASFAFGEHKAVLDGNVFRVLARYFGITTPIDSAAGKKLYALLADSLLPDQGTGAYNQAIMDFGAVICKPQLPLCSSCIQKADCEALRLGVVTELPIKEKSIQRRTRYFYYFLLNWKGAFYVRQRQGNDIWQDLHEWVLVESPAQLNDDPQTYVKLLKNAVGPVKLKKIQLSGEVKQQLSHQTITGRFITADLTAPLSPATGYQLRSPQELSKLAFPRFITAFSPKL
ncbi:A/G-specific adenine glycosylase [Flavihumibacter sp. CACIAM 22H1]|uniref:A/G-specific adenine glycosylase n=1 Tax=Flavihumibacter sp. CACIAM 22H1 TaxID=1812911 RepID=UPI000A3E2DEB|nr:A/G-specific adenine glycosylase [Flavihumibacter sp. CACIAM 22H1]